MDFKNILHKNVGNMKSKLPSMPKIPKIKSRKIFNLNRSKENVSIDDGNFATSQLSIGTSPHQSQLQLPSLPPSEIINRSPSRISTISSLVEGGQPIDYHISDGGGDGRNRNRRRIHFDDKSDQNNDNAKSTTPCFTERLTKQYKDFSEFKFSHIFGKKTIVRRTEIQVDTYTQSFEDQTNELAAERRISRDYEFEFQSIPAIGSNNSADEPHTPTAPSVHSIPSRTPSTAFGFQQQSQSPMNIQITNVDEIKNYAGSTSPPLSKRKVFNQKDYDESEAADEAAKQKKQNWKIKSWKKKSLESNDDGGGGNGTTKDSIKAKSNSGMWQLKKPSKIPASQDSIDENQEVTTDSFKKSLNNIFKKLPSLSSFDDPSDSNTKSPKKPGMWKLQRPVRVKVSTENIPNELNDTSNDSDFMKQFNKVVGKSSKIKKLIGKEPSPSTNQTTDMSPEQQNEDDPSKVKTMEEIESLGYGRKNLKYISMWKIRRRREIRRNEPFPLNRGNSQEDESLKTPGMWQLRRPTRTKTVINEGEPINNIGNPQLAEITKSLMNLFKRKQNSVDPTSVDEQIQEQNKSTTTDKYVDTAGSSSAQSRMWKFRQAIGKESFDTDVHFNQADIENKPGFWKKMSHKKKDSINENNEVNYEENIVDKPPSILDKAKKQITSRINSMQSKSNDSQESQQEPVKCNEAAASIDFKKKLQNSMDSFESCNDSDPETLEDLERINRNLTWGRQNMLSNAYSTDSDDEDVITTPGFLQNQPIPSVQYGEIEPTIIIVSKPVPTILQYQSVIQQQRLYPLLPIGKPSTPPPTTPPPLLPNNNSQYLELPHTVGLPTPPPPKRQISPPLIAQPDNILTPPQSPTPSSKSPTPPLLPTSLPPELSPPSKSLPPPIPTSPRPQLPTFFKTSPILEELSNPPSYLNNKSRYRHSRKPSMDSNDSESWIPPTDNLQNRNVLELNKIEETFEQWNSVNKSKIKSDVLKKWQSIDIFISNDDEIFDDFEDQLKNEPIITIAENIESQQQQQQSILNDMKNHSDDPNQPTGVPVKFEKHKITRPLVKQGSLRRQFSEEKDAEDLNKKRNVNKMISRFDPERGSSRQSIKYDRSQLNSTIIIGSTKDNDEKIMLKKEIETTAVVSDENHNSLMKNIEKSLSLDVEIDKNDRQSINDGSSTDDDSDNSDSVIQQVPARPPTVLARKKTIDNNNIIIQKIPEKNVMVIEKKLAPQPPSTIKPSTALTTKTLINNNQNDEKQQIVNKVKLLNVTPIIKEPMTIKTVKDSNENIRNLNINKKNILQQSRQQSEDNFYSLDYTEEDETVKGYPLDGMSLVKEEYSIEL